MRKHFIFLGAPGLIYYSWLLSIVFVGVCFAYESNKSFSMPSFILCSIFIILLVYTWFFSFIKEDNNTFKIKLPYQKAVKVEKPKLISSWSIFEIYEVSNQIEKYYYLSIKRRKNAHAN